MKYKDAIAKSVPYLKEQIDKSPDKTIRILIDDIKISLGWEFKEKLNIQIYWGVKAALIREGITVHGGKSSTGEDLLVMRMAAPEDYYRVAKLTAELMAERPLYEHELLGIIGKNAEDWRNFVVKNFMTED